MAENKEEKSVEELLRQIEEFEKTIKGLSDNVSKLKERLLANKEKYGDDISQWPKEAQ